MTLPAAHEHTWAPLPGPEYEFLPNRQLWAGEKAHVRCAVCGGRTWLSREEVAASATSTGQAND